MGDLLQPWHLIVLAVVAFLLFGAKRLPELGKGLGEGLKGFKEGVRGISDPAPTTTVQQAPPPPPVAPVAPATAGTTPAGTEMEYVVCTRCGNRFENPLGFKVADYVCRACQSRS
jgi:sec-independent protein translocase protein TatA